MTTLFDPTKYERAEVWFEAKEVHLKDGTVLPITKMWSQKGQLTEDPSEVLMIQAGKDNDWVSLRLLD